VIGDNAAAVVVVTCCVVVAWVVVGGVVVGGVVVVVGGVVVVLDHPLAADDRRVRLIDNPRRLQASAVNLAAARYGRGRRYMVRVDAHAGYPEAYVSRLVAEARRTGAASVVVAMDTVGRGGFPSTPATSSTSAR